MRVMVCAASKHGERPVWLFSSGPIGDPPKPDEHPVDAGSAVMLARARQHRVFAGRLDRDRLGLGERAVVAALGAPLGDYRNWAEAEANLGDRPFLS
ncbi:hypothetical protein GCM10009682_03590 [Luedemannella flava]|uniref:Uncharacterized protein n=1 Tax=Luedemannella flava TaxID=349316 RepID=A0ABN2LF68_9ACTN